MSVLAVGHILSAVLDENGDLVMRIQVSDLNYSTELTYGPVSPDTLNTTLMLNIKAAVKDFAHTEHGIDFGLLDTARVIEFIAPL